MTNTATLIRIWFVAGLLLILALSVGQMPAAHAATITVTTTADSGAGSLRQGIADAASGDTIDFRGSVTGGIILTTGELVIDKSLTIQGPGAASLAVDGNGMSRVFRITGGNTVEMSRLTIRNGSLSGSSSGGGIQSFGTLTLNSSTVADNKAGLGGGIANFATLTLNNSTISGNNANFGGGGIDNFGRLTLNNSTISDNTASAIGGGIHNSGGAVELKNTIVANNAAGGDCSGTAKISLGYNLDSDGTCSLNVLLGDKISANANLGLLLDNGGPTETHALLPNSDAIDMGDPAGCKDKNGVLFTTDQRGFVRPFGTDCDIGAYEFGSHLPSVGGLTSFERSSGSSSRNIALLAVGLVVVVAAATGGWYTRRRWLGNRS